MRQTEAAAGVGGKTIYKLFERDDARFDELGIHPRECEIESYNTEGALFKPAALLFRGVGSVVGGDHFEGAVEDALDQSLAVGSRAEGGIH